MAYRAIIGLYLKETMAHNEVPTPLIVMANKTDYWALKKITSSWPAIDLYGRMYGSLN